MSNPLPVPSRRRFVKLSVIGLTVLPLSHLLQRTVRAGGELPPVTEKDPIAQELGYVEDATQADVEKFPKRKGPNGATQFCMNCQFYSSIPNTARGSCANFFPGESVSATGWCNAWVQKVS
jgi:hypothetical protein